MNGPLFLNLYSMVSLGVTSTGVSGTEIDGFDLPTFAAGGTNGPRGDRFDLSNVL